MCDPLTITMAAVQAGGQISQGNAAKRQAFAKAQQDEYQAAVARDNALAEAQRIRRAGVMQRGETLSALAASGVVVGQGSALDAERYVMETSETDAAIAMLNGARQGSALDQQAAMTRRAGRGAQRAGFITAGTSLLASGSQWLRQRQPPAPVEVRTPIPAGDVIRRRRPGEDY